MSVILTYINKQEEPMSQHHDPSFCAALGKQWIDAWTKAVLR